MNEHSTHALQWLLDALAEDGDEIVVLRVVDPAGSDPILFKGDPEDAREKAKELLESVLEMNTRNYSVCRSLSISNIRYIQYIPH